MVYNIAILLILISLIFYLRYRSRITKKKKLALLRMMWGKRKDEPYYFSSIEKYALLRSKDGAHALTEQTLNDIDFQNVFSFIDRTNSRIGQQLLFQKITHQSNDVEQLNHLESDIKELLASPFVRENIQLELLRLNDNGAYHVCALLNDKLIERPKWFPLLFVSAGSTVAMFVMAFQYPVLWIWMLIPFGINISIHLWNKLNAALFSSSLSQLNILIDVCKGIQPIDSRSVNQEVRKSIAGLRQFQQKLRVMNFGMGEGMKLELAQLAFYLIELAKAFFLVEVISFFTLLRELENKKTFIQNLFNYIGGIDIAISIGSLRAGSETCCPEFTPNAQHINVEAVYHPLIPDCVRNNLKIDAKGVLITGSNMSGKTTFLRTIVINSVLAQSINTCFAKSFRTPILKQSSSIKIEDSLLDGNSYYLTEVNVMGALIHQVKSKHQNLFVMDEVFKGTNTVERIAAAKAILSYLIQHNNIVIASTHDVELSDLLEKEYDLYHFTEIIQNDQLLFDHKIKSGPLKTRNAIKILELSNYPEVIVNEANVLSGNFEKRK